MSSLARNRLSQEHAATEDTNIEWDQSNQQWWDWYMSLADNDDPTQAPVELPTPPAVDPLDQAGLVAEMTEPFSVSQAQVEHFQRTGWIKLK
ncbi:MAG: hypothetical protein AAF805_11890, partial [Planctomycetota bacterium]